MHSKAIPCVEVVQKAIDRVESTKVLNCVVDSLFEAALAQAKAIDAKIAAGEALGRLEGLPIVVKANIEGPSGSLVSASTPALATFRPTTVNAALARILAAGAIVIGKSNMCEMAIGFTGENPVHRNSLNPQHTGYNCGGSSSGTAVAIGAGIVSCGLGTDTAGSLRMPAAYCGCVGMRPSQGRWDGAGVVPISAMRDTPGPMGKTVSDVALVDAIATDTPLAEPASLAGLRVCIPEDWIAMKAPKGICEAQQRALRTAKEALLAAGAEVVHNLDFAPVTQTNAATWDPPFLSTPFEDSGADLQAYLDTHQGESGCPLDVAEVVTGMGGNKAKGILNPKAGTEEEIKTKLATAAEGIAQLEAAYREFFKANGVCVVLVPSYPNGLTSMSSEKMGGIEFANYAFPFGMNEIPIPSLMMPCPSVRHPESGATTSLFLLGVEDRDLLSFAMSLEEILKK